MAKRKVTAYVWVDGSGRAFLTVTDFTTEADGFMSLDVPLTSNALKVLAKSAKQARRG